MFTPLASMLERWHDFYVLTGTAAAALVALLFVATSIGAGFLTTQRAAATRTYMSPVVVHFTAVLFVSAMALVPSHTRASFAVVIGLTGAAGMVYSGVILIRLIRHHAADVTDRLGYGAVPLVAYAAALAAAGLALTGSEAGPDVLAGGLIALLIVNVRNAWDLALAMARKQSDQA
jgi:hypothetical protein